MLAATSRYLALAVGILTVVSIGCGKGAQNGIAQKGSDADKKVIRVEGSDTMVNIAQAWAEKYYEKNPDVSVQVKGGGSGVGIASLISGKCDLADSSRKMKPEELEAVRKQQGGEPIEHILGYDALAIYVHKSNPLDSISVEELAEIYGKDGKATKWSEVGANGDLADQQITRVSRQNSSGTYEYFREHILGKGKDFKSGSLDQSGSKDVVALVARTPTAIGYSGMGYVTPEVKMLKVSKKRGEPGIAPTVENAKNGSYPITRPLQIYGIGEPKGTIKAYLDWMASPEGQKVVAELGFVPL